MGQHVNAEFAKLLFDGQAELGGVDFAGAVKAHVGGHRGLAAQCAIVRSVRVEESALQGKK
jgi:hypothetical protein